MPDNATTSTPVNTSAPASGASSAPSTPAGPPSGGYTSTTDMFADLERMAGLNDKETMPDFSSAKEYKPGTEEDLLELGTENEQKDSTTETTAEEDKSAEATDEATDTQVAADQNEFKPIKIQTEVGGKSYEFDVSSKEQFDTIVQKAIVADQLYQKNRGMIEELEQLRNDRDVLNSMDKRLEEEPEAFLDDLTEDLPDEVLKNWIIKKAEELGQDPEQRAVQKKLRHAALLQEKLDRIEAEKAQLQEARIRAAREADAHTIKSWVDSQKTRLSTKIPEKYSGLVEDQIRSVIMEAREKTRRKENVNIQTLDTMLAQKIKPILDLISSIKPQTNVAAEVGRATQAKKQQGLTRIQNAAAARVPSGSQAKTRMQQLVANKDNPVGIFDEILKGMDDGRIRVIGE